MPKRICPICNLKVSQYAYGVGVPEGGAGWYFGTHYPVVGGQPCPASREDVAIVMKVKAQPNIACSGQVAGAGKADGESTPSATCH